MNTNTLEISRLSIDDLRREITAIKKLLTQFETIAIRDSELLSIKDKATLQKTPDTLQRLIQKKYTLIKKKEAFDNKVEKIEKELKSELNKLSDRKKLSYLLAHNLKTFTFGVYTLYKGVEKFIYMASKEILYKNTSVKEYLNTLHESTLDTQHPNYAQYLEVYNEKLVELEL